MRARLCMNWTFYLLKERGIFFVFCFNVIWFQFNITVNLFQSVRVIHVSFHLPGNHWFPCQCSMIISLQIWNLLMMSHPSQWISGKLWFLAEVALLVDTVESTDGFSSTWWFCLCGNQDLRNVLISPGFKKPCPSFELSLIACIKQVEMLQFRTLQYAYLTCKI